MPKCRSPALFGCRVGYAMSPASRYSAVSSKAQQISSGMACVSAIRRIVGRRTCAFYAVTAIAYGSEQVRRGKRIATTAFTHARRAASATMTT